MTADVGLNGQINVFKSLSPVLSQCPDSDIKITRQNATYDRLELSYLVS